MSFQILDNLLEKYGDKTQELLKNPIFFINNIVLSPYGWKLFDYAEDWIRLAETYDRINISAFRSSTKTQSLLVNYPLAMAFINPGWEGILVANALKQCKKNLRKIKDEMMTNELLRTAVPTGKDAIWNQEEIVLKNGSRIVAKAYNDNIRGEHVDWVGCDEIGEYRDHDVLSKAVTPTVHSKKGKIFCIGTPKSEIDLIHVLKKKEEYYSDVYAVNTEYKDGRTLWDIRYPDREYKFKNGKWLIFSRAPINGKIKIYDTYSTLDWSTEWLCNPMSAGDQLYPNELIELSFDYAQNFLDEPDYRNQYYMGMDFAMSAQSGADWTTVVVLERNTHNHLRLVFANRWKNLSYHNQKLKLAQTIQHWKPSRIIPDEGSFGAAFIEDIKHMAPGFHFMPLRFTNQQHSHTKYDCIANLRSLFETNFYKFTNDIKEPKPLSERTFFINKSKTDILTHMTTEVLRKELHSYGMKFDREKHTVKYEGIGEHDDLITALMLAAFGARGFGTMRPAVIRGSGNKRSRFII